LFFKLFYYFLSTLDWHNLLSDIFETAVNIVNLKKIKNNCCEIYGILPERRYSQLLFLNSMALNEQLPENADILIAKN